MSYSDQNTSPNRASQTGGYYSPDAAPLAEVDPNAVDLPEVPIEDQDAQREGGIKCCCCTFSYLHRLKKWDKSFLATLALQNFNRGFMVIWFFAYYYRFLTFYGVGPTVLSQYTAIIMFPWTPKLIYGFFTDTFPLFGSRRINYIILTAVIRCIIMGSCWFTFENQNLFVGFLFMTCLSGAVMDVVVDGLLVVQQRKDHKTGSEDLQTLCWTFNSVGGLLGSAMGGWLVQTGNDQWCFGLRAILDLATAICACMMDKSLEMDSAEILTSSFCVRFKTVAKDIWKGVKLPELYRALIYFLIQGSLIPNFSDYLYYYQIEVSGFSQVQYSYLSVLAYVTLFLSMFFYNGLLKNQEVWLLMLCACLLNCFGAFTTILYTTEHTFGMDPYAFVFLTSTVTDILCEAYTTLPAMVLFAKLIPKNVESSLFAFMTGALNFATMTVSREMGIWINSYVGVYYKTPEDNNLDIVWKLYLIQACICLLPIAFVWLLPTKKKVAAVQEKLAAEAKAADEARELNEDLGNPLSAEELLKAVESDSGMPDSQSRLNRSTMQKSVRDTEVTEGQAIGIDPYA